MYMNNFFFKLLNFEIEMIEGSIFDPGMAFFKFYGGEPFSAFHGEGVYHFCEPKNAKLHYLI